jgi:hypothetical protein
MPISKIEGLRWIDGQWKKQEKILYWADRNLDQQATFDGQQHCEAPTYQHRQKTVEPLGAPAILLKDDGNFLNHSIICCLVCYRHLPTFDQIKRSLKKWDLSNTKVVKGYNFLDK